MIFRRIDKDLPIPLYATQGSVGMDTYVREDTTIGVGESKLIPLNLVMQAPIGTFIGVLPRSSTFRKTGLILANSLGVVDQDYCGDEDEIKASVINLGNTPVTISRGDRLFQLLVINIQRPPLVEVESIGAVSRGGFGSTDNRA